MIAIMTVAERAEFRSQLVDSIEGLRDGRYSVPAWSTLEIEIAAVEEVLAEIDAHDSRAA